MLFRSSGVKAFPYTPKGKKEAKEYAKRTDSVKKAIANGALLKAVKPDAYYVVYFSSKPKPGGSSDQMITTALNHKIIDEVRYIEVESEPNYDDQLPLF